MNVWILIVMICVAIAAVTWAAAVSSKQQDERVKTDPERSATSGSAVANDPELAAATELDDALEGSTTNDDERPLSPVSETTS